MKLLVKISGQMKIPLQIVDLEDATGCALPSVAAAVIKSHIKSMFGVECNHMTVVHLGVPLADTDLVSHDMLRKSADVVVVMVCAPEPPHVSRDLVHQLQEFLK